MSSAIWMRLLLLLQLMVHIVHGSYLTTPAFVWSIPIITSTTPENAIFQKGNAIVALNDYGLLAITSSTGTLHIISSMDIVVNATTGVVGNTTTAKKSYTPTMIGSNSNLDTITCQGGIITAIQSTDDDSYIVLYAVTGIDSTAQFSPMSRILAIHTTTASLIWNITIPGTIVGTPVLSVERDSIYVVHNVVPTASDGSSSVGQVSIFQFNTNSNIFAGSANSNRPPTLITTLPSTPTGRPFGPGTVAINPTDGREYFFLAESSDDAFEKTFSDSLFAITVNDDNEFIFLVASNRISSSNTAPTIRNNNVDEQLDFFLGQPGSTVFGWVGNEAAELFDGLTTFENGSTSSIFPVPTWQIETSQDRDDEMAPIPNSPILPANGTLLYVTAAGPQILALDIESRGVTWTATDLNSVVSSKPIYDHQQQASTSSSSTTKTSPVIYFMESENSILHQYGALDGVSNWVTQCGAVMGDGNERPEDCSNVEADFAVVGNMLYYVDVVGNLAAMKVAEFVVKPAPTLVPVAAPVVAPVTIPVAKPITAPLNPPTKPSAKPTSKPIPPPTPNPTIRNPGTASPTILLRTNAPTTAANTDTGNATDEKSTQSWFADNMLIVGSSAGAALLILVLLFVLCAGMRIQRKNKNVRQRLGESKQVLKEESILNDEVTVATTPVHSNDKSFEILDVTASTGSPLTAIEEVDDDCDQISSSDIANRNEEPTSDDVAQNLLERFAVSSFDMEEGCDPQVSVTEGDALIREKSAQSENTMGDTYSLASKKEADDAASLTGTLSVASKGSSRSLKSSILSVLGMPGRTDNDSLRSSKSDKSDKSRQLTTILGQEISTARNIQIFHPIVSPISSPRPDYSEPGMIHPGQAASPLLAPGSPSHSLMSNDESLYMDESTIASLEIPNGENLILKLPHDALAGTTTVGELPSDCPEDEATNKLQPGLVYLNRHQAKKERLDQPIRSSLLDDTKRVQPMYNGVSVRPASRSRAGIFSRRQPKITTSDDNIDDTIVTPEVTPEPAVLRTRRTFVAPSSTTIDSAASQHSESQAPPVRFTDTGYYIEEPEPDDSLLHDNSTLEGQSNASSDVESQTDIANNHVSAKKDTWNSFLSELSKVENQFFNPTAISKKEKNKQVDHRNTTKSQQNLSSSGRPPVAAALPSPPPDIMDGSDSDEEVILPPPPAPRTFYA